ncbi:aldo/keto reductase [Collimonas sp.]|jgi:aryl-alcohol dehydrogenase-like predicted oxidoreductase|uniref:aldo/keto reductase n=1 Tax=Collimonas sp. TaxID=1963772 RepID=UPI002BA3E8D7|nr:aldo/keto reductase [Collimonas sp.]HWX04099.1 aldo/keto reductase [Collimonas sp.]
MQTVRFGRTGLKVSRFCLGTMSMGSSKWKGWVLDEDKTAPILKSALDLGINFFDMADWYSNGANEEVVGRTLLKLKQRDSLVLATKAFYAMSEDANDQGSSRKHLMASIDRSLRRIGTDYIDLYLLHAFDPHTPLAETMEALHDIVKSGKARYIGACTMYAWQFAEMNAIARENNWTEFVNMQCQYSLLYREEEREMMPYCQDKGIAVSTFSPLARGYLTGVQKSARTEHDPFLSQFFGDEIDVEIANRVVKIAADRGVQPGQVAMAWVAQNGNSTVPIIGADSPEQLRLAVDAGEIVLSAEECQYLEQSYRPRDMINDYNEVRRPRSYKS